MNRLYGLLTFEIRDKSIDAYYDKKCTRQTPSKKGKDIINTIMSGVPETRIPVFACFVCNAVLDTAFGDDILALDPNNTYTSITRDPDWDGAQGALLLHDLIMRPSTLRAGLRQYLDSDIASRVMLPEWMDCMAAGCLQLLREVYG